MLAGVSAVYSVHLLSPAMMSSNVDVVYKRMDDDLEKQPLDLGVSQIQRYFAGKTVFLTGATGFMGKCFVEKILRDCPDLKRLYVLVRQKKGVTQEEKMKKYFKYFVSTFY